MKAWPVLFWRYVFAGARDIFQRKFHSSSPRKEDPTQSFKQQNFITRAISNLTLMEIARDQFSMF